MKKMKPWPSGRWSSELTQPWWWREELRKCWEVLTWGVPCHHRKKMGSNSRASPLICGFIAQLTWQRSHPPLFVQEGEEKQFKHCCYQQKWFMGRSFSNHLCLFQSLRMASCLMVSQLDRVTRAQVPSINVLRQDGCIIQEVPSPW